jgi:MYXO-CTERM domain-containing protein
MKSLLANTTMESYDRSNCIGCHSKANFTNSAGTALSTDFMYFLQLEVSAPAKSRPAFAQPTQTPSGGGGHDDDGCQIGTDLHHGTAWWLLVAGAMLAIRRRRRA